jgi:hypothetical protein
MKNVFKKNVLDCLLFTVQCLFRPGRAEIMSLHNDLSALPFEKKIKLLDDAEKTCAGELIDRLLAERHEMQQPMPNYKEKFLMGF